MIQLHCNRGVLFVGIMSVTRSPRAGDNLEESTCTSFSNVRLWECTIPKEHVVYLAIESFILRTPRIWRQSRLELGGRIVNAEKVVEVLKSIVFFRNCRGNRACACVRWLDQCIGMYREPHGTIELLEKRLENISNRDQDEIVLAVRIADSVARTRL